MTKNNRKNTEKMGIAAAVNFLIFLISLFAVLWMVTGFSFGQKTIAFTSDKLSSFKFFTVDSNALMGIAAFAAFVCQVCIRGDRYSGISRRVGEWLLAGTTSVALTMMVTVFFLAPSWGEKWMELFYQSNFFLHLVIPLLSIINFTLIQPRTRLRFSSCLIGVLSMAIYAVCYSLNVLLHLDNGKVLGRYDWYGFLGGDLKNILYVIPLICAVTFLFSLVLYLLHIRKR